VRLGRDTNTGAKRAREARAAWGLAPDAPVACVLALAEERAGVPVLVAALPDAVAGWLYERRLLVVNGRHVVARQRFTVAHELGHLRCGHDGATVVDLVATVTAPRDPREVQANAFAAELLAPRAGVEALVGGRAPTLDDAVAIASRFGVSVPAAVVRLVTLGLASPERADRLREEADVHPEWLDVAPLHDGLEAIGGALPRMPPALAGSALAAALDGRASVAAAAQAAGADARTLGAALAHVT
jgi:Zn-dependent peptidase ImmA (M78 family)